MSLSCRQCLSWRPTGDLEPEQAIEHLIRVHPSRAVVLLKKLHDGLTNREPNLFICEADFWSRLDEALGHRSEYDNAFGVYE